MVDTLQSQINNLLQERAGLENKLAAALQDIAQASLIATANLQKQSELHHKEMTDLRAIISKYEMRVNEVERGIERLTTEYQRRMRSWLSKKNKPNNKYRISKV